MVPGAGFPQKRNDSGVCAPGGERVRSLFHYEICCNRLEISSMLREQPMFGRNRYLLAENLYRCAIHSSSDFAISML
jgi:hypothetical protein